MLQAIVGVDPNDSYTAASPYKDSPPDYLSACQTSGFERKRIGIARNVIHESIHDVAHTMKAFEHAVSLMASAGATIVENTDFTGFDRVKDREYNPVTRADFVSNLPQYLSKLEKNPNNIHSIHDLRNFTWNHPKEDYPRRNTRSWDTAVERNLSNTSPLFEALYQENLYIGGEGGIKGALKRHSLDAIVLPSEVAYQVPALVGTPIVTVPLGAAADDAPVVKEKYFDIVEKGPGIPFGISFLGAEWSEEALIGMAYAFEQRTLVRNKLRRRHIMPSVDLVDFLV